MNVPAYGLWPLVIINTLMFIIFAFSFTHPHTGRDWRSFGVFSAFLILVGFLLQWPTLLTLLMFPILVVMYMRLARHEEREVQAKFGEVYTHYAAKTPAFFPRMRHNTPVKA